MYDLPGAQAGRGGMGMGPGRCGYNLIKGKQVGVALYCVDAGLQNWTCARLWPILKQATVSSSEASPLLEPVA